MLQRLAEARAFLGLPKQKELDWKYLLGDLFLLRSLPELEGAPVWSDDDPVEFVGDLLWELESEVGASLTAFLEAARAQGKTIIYAQPGRTFDLPPTWPKIIEALRGNSFAVIADLTRLDGEAGDCPANFFMTDSAKQPVYLGQVLPHVDLPITGGHTTTALGALKYGKPQLMIAYGSGSGAIARKYAGAGIALHLDARTVMAEQISAGIDKLINESRFGERTAQLSTQLKSTGDFGRAAELIEAKFGGE
jgi:UDP:flavonoid glycosyltransferase YjiC (YdhE family)